MPPPSALSPASHLIATTLECQALGCNQRFSNFIAGAFQNPSDGLPGNIHNLRGAGLVHALIIYEPQGFKFFQGQNDFSGLFYSSGLKPFNGWFGCNTSGSFGSWHYFSSLWSFDQNIDSDKDYVKKTFHY
jgi:hypothetical protein